MPLTPPTVQELATHVRLSTITERWQEVWATAELQHAADLMVAATDLEEYPEDPMHQRIVRRGILAMAHALLVRGDDKDEEYNIFSSERIGSYSYQKAKAGEYSGVTDFDAALDLILDGPEGIPRTEADVIFHDPPPHEEAAQLPYPLGWGYDVALVRDP